jgi:hypothetical protein
VASNHSQLDLAGRCVDDAFGMTWVRPSQSASGGKSENSGDGKWLAFLWVAFTAISVTCPVLAPARSATIYHHTTSPVVNASMQIYEEINPCDDAVDLVANSSGVAWHEERWKGAGGGEYFAFAA